MSRHWFSVAATLAMLTALLVAAPARAATTWYVNNTVACDDATADSSVTPYCIIQAAIDDAASGDTIQIGPGSYTECVVYVVDIIGKNLTVVGAGQGSTFIDPMNLCGGVRASSADVAISDLTVQNGSSGGSGGGVTVQIAGSDLDLTDVTIKDSTATSSGGGIVVATDTTADLLRVLVSGNDSSIDGGGMSVWDGATVTITDSELTLNHATGDGGAISSGDSTVTVDNTVFDTNTGVQGGAINYSSTSGLALTITESRFTGNGATDDGGGIYMNRGLLVVDRSLFTLNVAANNGGGVAHDYTEAATDLVRVSNTTFYDNEATTGSGCGAYADGFFINTTFSGNSAGDDGGGLARNVFSTVNAANSIFADNAAGDVGPDCYGMWSEGHNLVKSDPGGSCILAGDTTGNLVGADPDLLPLDDNGGPTMTMAIPLGSPARNAGNPDAPDPTDWDGYLDEAVGDWSCAGVDQRGTDRDDERCDIGAFELDAETLVGLVDPGSGQWHLRDAAGTVTSFYFGNPGDYPFVGDWDCDGDATPGLYRQSDGFVYLRNSNTQGIADITFFFGNPGDVPIAGDFDNDGCDTVSIYRPSEGRFFIINALGVNGGGLGAAEFDYYFGNPGDKPFVGDFDGNGEDTIGLHRESTGLVYFRNSHTQGNADNQFIFGNPGDRLIAGDWNTDGIDSPAVYRPSNTTFYYRYTNTQGNADEQSTWGSPTWLPIAGTFGN